MHVLRLSALANPDIWWHLSTGRWIAEHLMVPHNGLVSQRAGSEWIDSSWGFDFLLGCCYKVLGLRALPELQMVAEAALAASAFVLAGGWRGLFFLAVGLCAVEQFTLGGLPTNTLLSAVLFAAELYLLLESRRRASSRVLLPMPVLLMLWANLDISFFLGLLLIAIFALAVSTESVLARSGVTVFQSALPNPAPAHLFGILAISALATLLNPYGYGLWQNISTELWSKAGLKYLAEMGPMRFRQLSDYIVLLLAMGTFLLLGRRRSRDLFKYFALAAAMGLAFRVQREVWCLVLLSIAFIGDLFWRDESSIEATVTISRRWEKCLVAIALILVVTIVCAILPSTDSELLRRSNHVLPIDACNFMRRARPAPPLFNSYKFGGFLAWYLPEYPASIDGRTALFGDETVAEHFKTVNGERPLSQDPVFSAAHTVLLEKNSKLARALTSIPALTKLFRVMYSDDVAIVFTRS